MPGAARRLASTNRCRPAVEALEHRTLLSGAAAGTIRGLVFNDADDNGRRSRREAGVAGISVFIDGNANGTVDVGEGATVTAADGSFEFSGVALGSHEVRATPPPDMRAGARGATAEAVLTPRRGQRLAPIGLVGLGTIRGTVRTTRSYPPNPYSVYDRPVRGVLVFLDLNADGARQKNEPFTRSGADGRYQLAGLAAGTYVTVTLARWPPFTPSKSTGSAEVGPGQWTYVKDVTLDFVPRSLVSSNL